MTANVNIEIARRDERAARAERGAALPADEGHLRRRCNQPVPPDIERALSRRLRPRPARRRARTGRRHPARTRRAAARRANRKRPSRPPAQRRVARLLPGQRRRADAGSPSGAAFSVAAAIVRRRRPRRLREHDARRAPESAMEERMAPMTPEEREQFQARMRERMAQAAAARRHRRGQGGGRHRAPAQRQAGQAGGSARATARARWFASCISARTPSTIDSLFGPLPIRRDPRPRVALHQQAAQAGQPAARHQRRHLHRSARSRTSSSKAPKSSPASSPASNGEPSAAAAGREPDQQSADGPQRGRGPGGGGGGGRGGR